MARTLRSLIVSVSAETSAYQREMQRAGRMGTAYLKTVTNGNRQATQAWRSQQAAIEAQNHALNNLKGSASGYFKAMASALVAGSIVTMADDWGQVASRLKMATGSQQEFIQVQNRLMEISDRTYKKYGDQAELFVRTSGTLKELGYSASSSLDFVDALMSGLTKGSANAMQTASTLDAVSKAITQGTLRGEDWNRVMDNAPAIVKALADGLGVTEIQLKKMAAAGQLTTDKWLPALISQSGKLAKEVEDMPTTIADAFTRAQNHIAKFVSEQNDAVGATQTVVYIINTLTNNIDLLATAVVSVGAAYATLKGAEQVKGLLERINVLRQLRGEEIGRATALLDTATINARVAAAEVIFAQQQVKNTAGTAAQAAALSGLRQAKLANVEATIALTAAEKAHAAATSLMGNAIKGALGFFGGPLGLAMLVGSTAASMLLFRDNTNQATRAATDFKRPISELKKELKELDSIQTQARQQALFKEQADSAQQMLATMNGLRQQSTRDGMFDSYGAGIPDRINAFAQYKTAVEAGGDIGELTQKLIEQIQPTDEVKREIIELANAYAESAKKSETTGQLLGTVKDHLDQLANSAINAGNSLRTVGVSDEQMKNAQAFLSNLQRRLISLKDKTGMEGLKFDLKAKDINENNPLYKQIIQTQEQIVKAEAEQGRLNKSASSFAKIQNNLEKSYSRQIAQLNEQIALFSNTSQVAKLKYDLAHGELSALKEQQKQLLINKTLELEQLNARKAYDDMMKGLQTKEEQAKETLRERLQILKDANLEADKQAKAIDKISKASIGEAPSFSGVDASVGGASGELIKIAKAGQELDKWRETELQKQKDYLDEKLINEETYSTRVLEINQKNSEQLTALQDSWRSATLGMFSSVTGDAAAMLKELGGESSAMYKVMFAVSKAASMAQAVVNTELAATRAIAELGPVAGIPMATAVRALGYTSIGIMASTALAGMAHSGIDNVPYEGTWKLKGGERVLAPEQNRDLTNYLKTSDQGGGGVGGNVQPQVTINIVQGGGGDFSATQGFERMGSEMYKAVQQIARATVQEEKGQGGTLDPNSRRR